MLRSFEGLLRIDRSGGHPGARFVFAAPGSKYSILLSIVSGLDTDYSLDDRPAQRRHDHPRVALGSRVVLIEERSAKSSSAAKWAQKLAQQLTALAVACSKLMIFLAPQVGLEPTTLRLTAECSAIELLRSDQAGNFRSSMILTQRRCPSSKG